LLDAARGRLGRDFVARELLAAAAIYKA